MALTKVVESNKISSKFDCLKKESTQNMDNDYTPNGPHSRTCAGMFDVVHLKRSAMKKR